MLEKEKDIVSIGGWNPSEKMTKEYALGVIDYIRQFYRRLYYQPQMKPFNTKEYYEALIEELNGLKEFIKKTANDNSKEIENAENIE